MQFNTLRRLGSISGRTIAAIALSSATVLALAPSAKATNEAGSNDVIKVTVAAINNISYTANTTGPTPPNLEMGYAAGSLTARNNSGTSWTIKAYSSNNSMLKGKSSTPSSIGYKLTATLTGSNPTGTPVTDVKVGSTSTSAVLLYTGTAATLLDVTLEIKLKTDAPFNTVKADEYSDAITYIIANGS